MEPKTESILFYGVPSGCSFGSIVALEWLGMPYKLCRVEMPKDVESEAYRRLNPVGETPTLMTSSGALVSESMAILNHLAPGGIDKGLSFAQGTPEFDRLNQVLAFLNTSLFKAYSPFWYAFEHSLPSDDKAALRRYGTKKLAKAHADLENMLGDGDWLLGNRRTLADAYFIGIARWNEYHDAVDRRDYPRVQRLFDRLEADPAVQFAHAVEARKEAHTTGGFKGEIDLAEALRLLK